MLNFYENSTRRFAFARKKPCFQSIRVIFAPPFCRNGALEKTDLCRFSRGILLDLEGNEWPPLTS